MEKSELDDGVIVAASFIGLQFGPVQFHRINPKLNAGVLVSRAQKRNDPLFTQLEYFSQS